MYSPRRAFGKTVTISIPAELASETTLLAYLGVSPAELKKIWWFRGRMYHHFNIAKGQGKIRSIAAPDKRLKIIQRKIAVLLDQLYRVRTPVHAFVPDRSVKTNAESHGAHRHVLNIDLQDFFGSITETRVIGVLVSIGVDKRVSEIIARICCLNSKLPQGAPTSPVISNMICFRIDTDLMIIAKKSHAIYTRYADDITFSSYHSLAPLFETPPPPPGKFSPEILDPNLKQAIISNGFSINNEKAFYANRNSRRVVTGVKINSGLNVDRRYIRQIRAKLHSIEKLGLAGAQAKYKSANGKGQISDHLHGKISYVAHLKGRSDPVIRSLILRYNKSFVAAPIKLEPTIEERRERSVWVVDNQDDHGTCFFLKGVGLVTSAHCVEGSMSVQVLHPSKHTTKFQADIIHRCEHRDLAILDTSHIPPSEFYEMEASSNIPKPTDPALALGYPSWGLGERLNIRSGFVTILTRKFGVQIVEVTQQLSQGMSGGPILDNAGKVIGIIRSGGPQEPRQFSVDVREINGTLNMGPDEKPKPTATSTNITVLESPFSKWLRIKIIKWLRIE